MGFFSVLGDIGRNKDNFRKWEQQERDNDAKRKALYAKGVGKERLAEAKRRGDVIIDAITQMDQHSENVAEDVETAVSQASGFALMPLKYAAYAIGAGLAILGSTKLDKTTKEFLKNHNLDDIKSEIIRSKGKKAVSVVTLDLLNSKKLSKYKSYLSENNYSKLARYTKEWAKTPKPYIKYFVGAGASFAGIIIGGMLLMQYMGTKMQIGSSRIARWQSRENLKDPKNFVVYTDEQIAQAEENLKGQPQKKSSFFSNLFSKEKDVHKKGMIRNIKDILRDKEAYEEWKSNDKQEMVEGPLSEEQIKQAKQDKELIQRITKKINNKAEEYSENMETAAETLIGSSLLGGAVLGGSLGWIIEKTGIGEKLAYRKLEKVAGADIVGKIKEVTKNTNISAIERNNQLNLIKKEIKDKILNNSKQNGSIWGEIFQDMTNYLKTRRYTNLVTKSGRISSTTKALGVITTIIGGLIAVRLQKSAARAGRYIAKKEFKDNPEEFLSYTDEEMATVADVKGTHPSVGQKFKKWISFVPTSIKHMWEYNKYKNTELQQKEKLREELVKNVKVSDKQLQDAKNLQRKLYNTFEKVDEKSQSYSEYMEFANEASQPLIVFGGVALAASPLIATAIGVATGKITVTKLADWTTNLLAKISSITKSGLFKKHIAEMGQKANALVDSGNFYQSEANRFWSGLFEKLKDPNNESVVKKQVLKILGIAEKDFETLSRKEFLETINSIFDSEKVQNVKNAASLREALKTVFPDKASVDDLFQALEQLNPNNLKRQLIKGPVIENINKFLEENISREILFLELKGGQVDEKLIGKIIDRLDTIIKNFPKGEAGEALKCVLAKIVEKPDEFAALIQNNPQEFLKVIYTPTLKKVLVTAGISYGAFVTLITYLLASKFASMQKDAGRLGVMKALEDMENYRYYADEISETNTAPNSTIPQETPQNTSLSQNAQQPAEQKLLKNYIKYVPKSAA